MGMNGKPSAILNADRISLVYLVLQAKGTAIGFIFLVNSNAKPKRKEPKPSNLHELTNILF